ncbi:MAG: phospholipase A [Campylobacteraceae bacterium]|jgi:phospholipase A1|nr:phospholipase A [Campylobacteraceae bacterium]
MTTKIFFALLFASSTFCVVFGNETTAIDAYELAEKYESENRTNEALFWYKKAAQSFKDLNANSSSKLEEFLINERFHDKSEDFIVKKTNFTNEYEDNETKNTVSQMIESLFGITTYKSNYLLPITYDFKSHEDRKRAETVFQISVKKDFLKNFFGFNEVFEIAYTQRSWWQTMRQSSPFRETNYIPEIYVSIPDASENSIAKIYKFGFLHESNGQAENNSRSWNRLYFELFSQYKGLFVNSRVWYRLKERAKDDDNIDVLDYMGYGDLTLIYPYKEHLFKLLMRNNLNFHDNRGAVQFDWTFPLAKSGIFGYMQYFDGYGESLIDYNKQTRRIGVGLSISR